MSETLSDSRIFLKTHSCQINMPVMSDQRVLIGNDELQMPAFLARVLPFLILNRNNDAVKRIIIALQECSIVPGYNMKLANGICYWRICIRQQPAYPLYKNLVAHLAEEKMPVFEPFGFQFTTCDLYETLYYVLVNTDLSSKEDCRLLFLASLGVDLDLRTMKAFTIEMESD